MPITISPSIGESPAQQAVLDNIQHCYNDKWPCPLTPAENRLKVAVRAGEKVFEGAIHD